MQDQSISGTRALALMEEALLVLDESSLPCDIGAHLDLAIERLRRGLGIPLIEQDGVTRSLAR